MIRPALVHRTTTVTRTTTKSSGTSRSISVLARAGNSATTRASENRKDKDSANPKDLNSADTRKAKASRIIHLASLALVRGLDLGPTLLSTTQVPAVRVIHLQSPRSATERPSRTTAKGKAKANPIQARANRQLPFGSVEIQQPAKYNARLVGASAIPADNV